MADIVRNSSSSNNARNSVSFRGSNSRLFSSKSTGTSILMVARNREKIICSLFSSILVFNAPLSSLVRSSKASMLPNSFRSFTAVFSPTPGQPGILSEVSPIKPNKSITCSWLCSSYLAFTSSGPITSKPPVCLGRYIKI